MTLGVILRRAGWWGEPVRNPRWMWACALAVCGAVAAAVWHAATRGCAAG